MYKESSIRLIADFSSETIEARRHCNDICKELRKKTCLPSILYLAKLPFKNEGEIKTFSDKQQLKDC